MDALKLIAQDSLKAEVPSFEVGDSVRVHVKIKEGDRERIQVFEGTVIAKKHGGVAETFTVRRVSHGCGVERVFPLHSPNVTRWRLSVRVVFAVRNCTTSETEWARLQRSNPKSDSFDKAKAGANQRRLFIWQK